MSGYCTPGKRVRTLVDMTLRALKEDHKPLTIANFKRKAEYIGNEFPFISKESRKEMKRQALRMWCNDVAAIARSSL